MKILFLTENFPPETNAAATRVFERACYWVREGHDVTVITQAPNFPFGKLYDGYRNSWRQIETIEGIRIVRVKTYISANEGVALRTLDFISYMVMAVFFGLFERKPDIVVSTSPQFFAAVGGWLISAFRRIPFVFELGDLWPASIVAVGAMKPSFAMRMVEKLELFLYRRSAVVVALTNAFKKNLIERGIDGNKIAVVINGVDLPRYAPQERDADLAEEWALEDKFVIGYVGTHGMAHGLENVLEVAAQVSDRTNLVFMFAGPGAVREQLIQEAKERNLKNVIFVPPKPKDQMPAVWSLCDVALVHLKDTQVFAEVIPSKIFEAMGMGLPILIAAPQGEATDIIQKDKVGLVVPPENPEALANAALQFCDDEAFRTEAARNSYAAAPKHSRAFQAEAMMAALIAAIENKGDEAAARVAQVEAPS
ncbi:MAG: glycosyltransferase WbuB [Rhodospirillaceae bacterium]|nr:glycosyltransferase WbuB [Rhodospirillaceae bacterium]